MKTLKVKSILVAALLFSFSILMTSCSEKIETPLPDEQEAAIEALENLDLTVEMTEEEFKAAYELVGTVHQKEEVSPNWPYWEINSEFEISYRETISLSIGGAVYNGSLEEWMANGTAGNVTLPAELFEAIDGGLSHHVRFQVQSSWFFLRQARITLLDQGNTTYYGLYNAVTGDFLFFTQGSAGGEQVNGVDCGYITLGAVAGRLSGDRMSLSNGTVSNGIFVGCVPFIIGGSATVFYEGNRIVQ